MSTKACKKANYRLESAPTHPALAGCFTYCYYKSGLQLKERMNQAIADFGLIAPQFGILIILKAQGPLNQNTLGDEMGIDKATMVRLIDGLEKLGAVERTVTIEDRRAKAIKITSTGIALCAKANHARLKLENEFLSALGKSDRKVFQQGVGKLLAQRARKG